MEGINFVNSKDLEEQHRQNMIIRKNRRAHYLSPIAETKPLNIVPPIVSPTNLDRQTERRNMRTQQLSQRSQIRRQQKMQAQSPGGQSSNTTSMQKFKKIQDTLNLFKNVQKSQDYRAADGLIVDYNKNRDLDIIHSYNKRLYDKIQKTKGESAKRIVEHGFDYAKVDEEYVEGEVQKYYDILRQKRKTMNNTTMMKQKTKSQFGLQPMRQINDKSPGFDDVTSNALMRKTPNLDLQSSSTRAMKVPKSNTPKYTKYGDRISQIYEKKNRDYTSSNDYQIYRKKISDKQGALQLVNSYLGLPPEQLEQIDREMEYDYNKKRQDKDDQHRGYRQVKIDKTSHQSPPLKIEKLKPQLKSYGTRFSQVQNLVQMGINSEQGIIDVVRESRMSTRFSKNHEDIKQALDYQISTQEDTFSMLKDSTISPRTAGIDFSVFDQDIPTVAYEADKNIKKLQILKNINRDVNKTAQQQFRSRNRQSQIESQEGSVLKNIQKLKQMRQKVQVSDWTGRQISTSQIDQRRQAAFSPVSMKRNKQRKMTRFAQTFGNGFFDVKSKEDCDKSNDPEEEQTTNQFKSFDHTPAELPSPSPTILIDDGQISSEVSSVMVNNEVQSQMMSKFEKFEDQIQKKKTGMFIGFDEDVLDPDITDEERQMRYNKFKKVNMKKLGALIRRHKMRHRIENPDEYDSDDSLASLFEEGQPRRMIGKLPKNEKTGSFYKIPNKEEMKKILQDNAKTLDQIMDKLIPQDLSIQDQLSSLAIMQDHKLITKEMIIKIKEREDKLSQYVNFLTGQKMFISDGHGALSSDKMFTHGITRQMSKSFSNYVDFCDHSRQRVANGLVHKLKYFQKCKNSMNPRTRDELSEDPHFAYFSQCQSEMELAIPILEKVHNKTLMLNDYSLSDVHTRALVKASRFFDNFINRILFDNCGMTDVQFGRILVSLSELQDFKSIIYRNNEFGLDSVNGIKELTAKRIPNHLEELRIVNCKINHSTTEKLIKILRERSYLSKLSLVNCNLTENALTDLCSFIKRNKFIEYIDLSWNNMAAQKYEVFLKLLSDNRRLKFVNLAWNALVHVPLISHQTLKDNPQLLNPKPEQPPLTQEELNVLTPKKRQAALLKEKLRGLSESEIFVANCLSRFIKYNSNLHHLELQGTSLTEHVLKEIARALRKSRSLVGIHLSENIGLTKEVRDYLFERTHSRQSDFKERIIMDLSRYEDHMKVADQKMNYRIFQESLKIREINLRKKQEVPKQIYGVQRGFNQCVLTRYNGFKDQMPGKPGQWQMKVDEHEQCWICDKWTYALVFFSPSKLQNNNAWNQQEEMKHHILDKLKLCDGVNFDSEDNDDKESRQDHSPAKQLIPNINVDQDELIDLYANFTNWEPMNMIPFLQFVEMIDTDKPNIMKLLKEEELIETEGAEQPEDLSEEELQLYIEKLNEYRRGVRTQNWERILQINLRYKKPAILNLQPYELERPERLYVLPTFIKSGKQNIMFRVQDLALETREWVLERDIVDYRIEDILKFTKQMKSHCEERKFDKKRAVFKDWIEDDQAVMRKCFNQDQMRWKMFKFIRDPKDRDNTQKVLEKHFGLIKSVFTNLQSKSIEFPEVGQSDINKFIMNPKFLGHMIKGVRVDQLYQNSILDKDPMYAYSPNMRRWAFMEFVVRIAIELYLNGPKKQVTTFAGATEKFIEEKLIKDIEQIEMEPWQSLRDDLIWTLDVDDLLRVNLEGLQQVYLKYCGKAPKLSRHESIEIFVSYSHVNLGHHHAAMAYGMSKMTVAEEYRQNEKVGYLVMEFVEFLEMICRVALFKFKGSDLENLELCQKVEFILDDVLALVGYQRMAADVQIEEISESDEDY